MYGFISGRNTISKLLYTNNTNISKLSVYWHIVIGQQLKLKLVTFWYNYWIYNTIKSVYSVYNGSYSVVVSFPDLHSGGTGFGSLPNRFNVTGTR